MLGRTRAMAALGYLLPTMGVAALSASILLGIALVQAADPNRLVEFRIEPSTSQGSPAQVSKSGITDLTVWMDTNGNEVTGVTLDLNFKTRYLQVLDGQPGTGGVQISPHPNSPLRDFEVENAADNVGDGTNGTVLYTAGSANPVSGDVPLAVIRFKAKDDTTPVGSPTEIVFKVDDGNQTAASKDGAQLLRNTSDFTGAWVEVVGAPDRVVEFRIEPFSTQVDPSELPIGGSGDFTVWMNTNGKEVSGLTLDMTFKTTYLKVLDGLPGTVGIQIRPHPNNPLRDFEIENTVDNTGDGTNGHILYTIGSPNPVSGDVPLAIISFMAKQQITPLGSPTEVVFLVDNGNKSAASLGGAQLLKNTSDFTGAWIEVNERLVRIVIEQNQYATTPRTVALGETFSFDVNVLTSGILVSGVSLSMTFKTAFLEVVDAQARPGVQIQPHPGNPLTQFEIENEADNSAGTIRYTVGSTVGTPNDFPVAIITFRAKAPTSGGTPTPVTFLVEDGNETSASRTGALLLEDRAPYTGALVEVLFRLITKAVIDAPAAADEGQPVRFTGDGSLSASGDLTYLWDFGDGNTADTPNATHIYEDNGTTVTLTVTDATGTSDTATADITIRNVAPTILDVTRDPASVDEGQTSRIAVLATDVPGDLPDLLYSFDCDDNGAYDVGPQAPNTADCPFPDDSVHTVVVKVDDQDGGISTGSTTVQVNNVPPTVVRVTATPDTLPAAGGTSLITVDATDVPADVPDLLYSFDCDGNGSYGDSGDTANQAHPDNDALCDFTGAGLGPHTVNVKVDDQDGGIDTGDVTVTLVAQTTAVIDAPSTGAEFSPITFDGSLSISASGTLTYVWDFGDGKTGDGAVVAHVYDDNAVYTAGLIVTDGVGGTSDDIHLINIFNVAPNIISVDASPDPINEGG